MKKNQILNSDTMIFILSLLSLSCFGWIPSFEAVTNIRIFGWPDSLFLLGAAGIGFLIGKIALPNLILELAFKISKPRQVTIAAVLVLSLVLIGALYGINKAVLNSFLSSADEHSCYFLAECLSAGKLWVPVHPLQEFFDVVHVGSRAGKWFSVYPPGWPLIWMVGLEWGVSDWLNPMMAGAAFLLFFLSGRILFGSAAALMGLLLVAISPFFLFTSASYFSHTTCLLMIAIFLYAFLKWTAPDQKKDRLVWGAVVAFAVGYGLMTRYLTMAAIAAPFLIYHYWPLLCRRRPWRKSDWLVPGIIGIFFLLILWQNYQVTGKPFRAPNKFDKSWERLGFRADYTPLTALNYLVARFFYLMDWLPGAWIAIYFVGCFSKRGFSPLQQITRFVFFAPAIAYFFYYSWGGNQWGPRYYYEGIPFLGLALGDTLVSGWKTGDRRLCKGLLAVLVISLGTNLYLFSKHARFHGEASSQRKALYVLAEKNITEPSIVFIQGFLGSRLVMAQEDAVRNSPFLDSKILYAHDKGDRNQELLRYYPSRKGYLGRYDSTLKKPVLTPMSDEAFESESAYVPEA